MTLIRLLAVLALVFSTNVYAQNSLFTSSEGSFSIALPVKPTEEASADIPDTKPGGKMFKWILAERMMIFVVAYADSVWAKEGEEAARANLAADGLIEAFEARGDTLVSRREITAAGFPGVEVKYRKKQFTMVNRYYVVGPRIYFILGMCEAGPNEVGLLKTLGSFQLAVAATKKG